MSKPILALHAVEFFRPDNPAPRRILSPIEWAVMPQTTAAILGANGSGKSTLLRLIAGYLWPTKGAIELLGHTLGTTPVHALRRRVGIVESTSVYPFDEEMTALEVACSGHFSSLTLNYVTPTSEQWETARHSIQQVGLADRAGQAYVTLSTGQRMRTLIARALVARPELLLLDEPTAGLDLPAREAVLATLHQLTQSPHRPAVIVVTHHLEELLPDTANVLLLSSTGQPTALGSPETVLTDANLSAAYACPVHVSHRNQRYSAHVDPITWPELLKRL